MTRGAGERYRGRCPGSQDVRGMCAKRSFSDTIAQMDLFLFSKRCSEFTWSCCPAVLVRLLLQVSQSELVGLCRTIQSPRSFKSLTRYILGYDRCPKSENLVDKVNILKPPSKSRRLATQDTGLSRKAGAVVRPRSRRTSLQMERGPQCVIPVTVSPCSLYVVRSNSSADHQSGEVTNFLGWFF